VFNSPLISIAEECKLQQTFIPMFNHLQTLLSFIRNSISSSGQVFVYGTSGGSSAPFIVIAYLIHTFALPFVAALSFVREKRRIGNKFLFFGKITIFKYT
jgi:hypothetical protein